MLEGIKRAVLFAAHTDDEMICAGTLHRLGRMGCEVSVVAFGTAATEQDREGGEMSSRIVQPEWHASMERLGVDRKHRHFLDFKPSARMASRNEEICQYAYNLCEMKRPDAVFTLSPDDENTAHAVVGRECERVMRGRVPIAIRCQFPWNYSIGRSNLFVKLDEDDLRAKFDVIECYKSQKFRYAYGRMLLHYAEADGLSVKVPAAEKFEVIRMVV